MKTPFSIPTWVIVISSAVAAALIVTATIATWGWNEHGLVLASRYTARFSFYWFMVAWASSTLASTWPGGWRELVLARRRALGLAFAAAHGVHFVALATAIGWFEHPAGLAHIAGGGLGYVFVAAMAVTSNDASIRILGSRHWRLLHATGGWIIFIIFFASYAASLATKPLAAIPAVSLMTAIVILKTARLLRTKWRRPTLDVGT